VVGILAALSAAAVAEPWPLDNTGTSHRIWHSYGQWQESGGIHLHEGIDMPDTAGKNVKAVKKGKVVNINVGADPYDSYITISDDGNATQGWGYVHVTAKVGLSVGDTVNVGDVIGTISTTAGVLSHLHFERDSNANGGWPNAGGGIEHLLDDPLLYLSPRADATFPTIDAGFKYRRAGDEGNDASAKYMSTLKCGKTWIGSRATNGSGNVDVIVSAFDKFAANADKLSVQDITFHAIGRIADATPTLRELVDFSGTGANDFAQQKTDNFNDLFRTVRFAEAIYENDNVANSAEEGPFWYIVTNQDTDQITEPTDDNWFWDTDGLKAGTWNDQASSDERAPNNAKGKFRDDYYDIYINVRDEAANVTARIESVVLDNWLQTVAANKNFYLLGEKVDVAKGSQHQATDTVPEYIVRSYVDCSPISSIVASGTTTSDVDGELAYKNIWTANQTGQFYLISDYDHDSKYVSVLDAVDAFFVMKPTYFRIHDPIWIQTPPFPAQTFIIGVTPDPVPIETEIIEMQLTGSWDSTNGSDSITLQVQLDGPGEFDPPDTKVKIGAFYIPPRDPQEFPDYIELQWILDILDSSTLDPGILIPSDEGDLFELELDPLLGTFDLKFDVDLPTGVSRYWFHGEAFDPSVVTIADAFFFSPPTGESVFDATIDLELLDDPSLLAGGAPLFSIEVQAGKIPEPATISLLALGALAVLRRRRSC
jgi:hypothetical protein